MPENHSSINIIQNAFPFRPLSLVVSEGILYNESISDLRNFSNNNLCIRGHYIHQQKCTKAYATSDILIFIFLLIRDKYMYLLFPPQKKIRQSCGSEVFPPVLAVVEDGTFAFLAILFLEKRDLVADSEFYIFSDMTVGLGKSLKIHIVPYTVF